MKQGQTLCWCAWCGTELVAGGYCYCLDIGCLCPACLPEYARVRLITICRIFLKLIDF